MKRKLFGGLLAAALIVTQAMTVMAAGSAGAKPELTPDLEGQYTVDIISDSTVQTVFEGTSVSQDVQDAVVAVNNGTGTLEDVANAIQQDGGNSDVVNALQGAQPVTGFFDIQKDSSTQPGADGLYEVSFEVPSLSGVSLDGRVVMLLHYVTETGREGWELIPAEYDPTTGTVTAKFSSFSPVSVITVLAENVPGSEPTTPGTTTPGTTEPGTSTQTGSTTTPTATTLSSVTTTSTVASAAGVSPKTGVESTGAVWMIAAMALAAAGAAAYRKATH